MVFQELGSYHGHVRRLEAAEICTSKFAREHARARPQDVFSVVTFHETSRVLVRKVSCAELFQSGVDFEDRAANGTFYLQALSTAALLLKESPNLQGELCVKRAGIFLLANLKARDIIYFVVVVVVVVVGSLCFHRIPSLLSHQCFRAHQPDPQR